jgi:hypothetical protein
MSCIRSCTYAVLVAACAVVYFGAGAAAETGRTTVASLERDIKANGAPAVVKKLKSGKSGRWRVTLREVESGDPAWLQVARQLLQATDAGSTEDLYFALSIALTRNAKGVLLMLGPDVPAGKICTVPYIEPSARVELEYRSKARAALAKVTGPDLASQKDICLKELAVGEKK